MFGVNSLYSIAGRMTKIYDEKLFHPVGSAFLAVSRESKQKAQHGVLQFALGCLLMVLQYKSGTYDFNLSLVSAVSCTVFCLQFCCNPVFLLSHGNQIRFCSDMSINSSSFCSLLFFACNLARFCKRIFIIVYEGLSNFVKNMCFLCFTLLFCGFLFFFFFNVLSASMKANRLGLQYGNFLKS